jgi:Holliday junction DNA helicase RuvB
MFIGPVAYQLAKGMSRTSAPGPQVKRGEEILDGPYPKRFSDFIGQQVAKDQIIAAVMSAAVRKTAMSHILLASGQPGIGKTALARLAAECRDVGFVELGGKVTEKDAAAALNVMEDGDVLFLDEVHRLGASGSEWLLTLLQDGALQLRTGVVKAPDITVIAATTDAQKLPRAVLNRFHIAPALDPYTLTEAVQIAKLNAERLGFGDYVPMPEEDAWLERVAKASLNNPRRMTTFLTAVRDDQLMNKNSYSPTGYDLTTAMEWTGVTEDGITRLGQEYLIALFTSDGVASITTLQRLLNEDQLRHTEGELINLGFVEVTGKGRALTEYGMTRARELALAYVENNKETAA